MARGSGTAGSPRPAGMPGGGCSPGDPRRTADRDDGRDRNGWIGVGARLRQLVPVSGITRAARHHGRPPDPQPRER